MSSVCVGNKTQIRMLYALLGVGCTLPWYLSSSSKEMRITSSFFCVLKIAKGEVASQKKFGVVFYERRVQKISRPPLFSGVMNARGLLLGGVGQAWALLRGWILSIVAWCGAGRAMRSSFWWFGVVFSICFWAWSWFSVTTDIEFMISRLLSFSLDLPNDYCTSDYPSSSSALWISTNLIDSCCHPLQDTKVILCDVDLMQFWFGIILAFTCVRDGFSGCGPIWVQEQQQQQYGCWEVAWSDEWIKDTGW
jgi:hypothetical protein